MFGFLAFMFLAIGIALGVMAVRAHRKAFAAAKWPKVDAVVRSTDIETFHPSSQASDMRTSDNRPRYKPIIVYEYVHEGEAHTSDKRDLLGVREIGRSAAEEVIARYPVDSVVQATINPANPSEAYLEPVVSKNERAMLVFGGVLSGLGVLFLILELIF